VGLGTPAVVRLVGALAHVRTPSSYNIQGASKLQDATLAERGGATARPYAGRPRRSTIACSGTPLPFHPYGDRLGLCTQVVNLFPRPGPCRPRAELMVRRDRC
jgi:hypothetical protein